MDDSTQRPKRSATPKIKLMTLPPGGPSTRRDMIFVYDAKRGDEPETELSEGCIVRLYFLPYEGDPMFEIEDGDQRSFWPRLGDISQYMVGRRARIEHTRGKHSEVIRIWVGDVA